MAKFGTIKPLTVLELFLDACLLVAFSIQTLFIGCLLTFGAVPIPADWANALIAKLSPSDYRFVAESYNLAGNGAIELKGIQLFDPLIDAPIIEAEAAEIQLSLSKKAPFIGMHDLVLTGGVVYLPAVHAPNGQRTEALRDISFELVPLPDKIAVQSFAAKHTDLYVRGSLAINRSALVGDETATSKPRTSISQSLFPLMAEAMRQRERYRILQKPTLFLKVETDEVDAFAVDLRLSSRTIKHTEFQGNDFRIDAAFKYKAGQLLSIEPLQTSARRIEIPRFDIHMEQVDGELSPEQWNQILNGKFPAFTLSAASIVDNQLQFKAPLLRLNLADYPVVEIDGSASSFGGAIHARGQLDLGTQSGEVAVSGNVNLLEILPSETAQKMPAIKSANAPYYHLDLKLREDYQIEKIQLRMDAQAFSLGGIDFDSLQAKGSIHDGFIDFDHVLLQRKQQWLDLDLRYDTKSKDYAVGLLASAIPTDYNAILPSWWEAIFESFTFTETTTGLGDFVIYGNGANRVSDLVYGSAEAANLSYRGVPLDSGKVLVRGRQRYYEVDLADLRSGEGSADGLLRFTSLPDPIQGLVSVRYDFDASLPIDSIISLLGPGTTADAIANFQTDSLIDLSLQGAYFSQQYPKLTDKTYFDLSASIDQQLYYRNTPLDHLDFELYNRDQGLQLRNVNFGYADGDGQFEADINNTNWINFELSLLDADKAQSIKDLPQLDAVEGELGVETSKTSPKNQREEARLDFSLQAEGPMDDFYQFTGFGELELRDKKLASVRLLGPLSKMLESTKLSFTSLNLNTLSSEFSVKEGQVNFDTFTINGPQTRINGRGTMKMEDRSLDMRVSVAPFGNAVAPDSTLRKVTSLVNPIPKLLEFKLTGTLEKQSWRSLYDPRNLIPGM